MSADQLEQFREAHGLNQPFLIKYLAFLGQIVTGNREGGFFLMIGQRED